MHCSMTRCRVVRGSSLISELFKNQFGFRFLDQWWNSDVTALVSVSSATQLIRQNAPDAPNDRILKMCRNFTDQRTRLKTISSCRRQSDMQPKHVRACSLWPAYKQRWIIVKNNVPVFIWNIDSIKDKLNKLETSSFLHVLRTVKFNYTSNC